MNRLLLLAALATAPALRAAEVEPLLPAETEQVFHVNVKSMFESDVVKKNALPGLKDALAKKEAKDFLEEIGFDPLKDLETITMGTWGEKLNKMSTLTVLHGTFDANKLFAAAEKYAREKADVVSIVEEGDYKLVRFVGGDGKPGFAAVADERTLVVGSEKEVVASTLDAAVKKAKPAISRALSQLVLRQDDKAALYYCGLLEDKFKDLPEAKLPPLPLGAWPIDGGKINDGLKALSTLAVTVRVGKEIFLDLVIGMKDIDSADDFGSTITKVVELLKTLLPLAALQQPKLQNLTDEVTSTIKTKVKDKTITLSVKVSAKAIAQATGKDDDEE